MNKQSFSNLYEARVFARSKAKEIGCSVKTERDGNDFVVIFHQQESINVENRFLSKNLRKGSNFEKAKKTKVSKKKREQKEIEDGLNKIQFEQERKAYLNVRKEYFESLSDRKLDILWADRASSDMKDDEILILRSLVRDRKGITSKLILNGRTIICPTCLCSTSNCTYGRGWW